MKPATLILATLALLLGGVGQERAELFSFRGALKPTRSQPRDSMTSPLPAPRAARRS
jgi:hypothetical protein